MPMISHEKLFCTYTEDAAGTRTEEGLCLNLESIGIRQVFMKETEDGLPFSYS